MTNDEFLMTKEARNPKRDENSSHMPSAIRSFGLYPAAGFGGQGTVSNVLVRCLSPDAQVLCHAHGR